MNIKSIGTNILTNKIVTNFKSESSSKIDSNNNNDIMKNKVSDEFLLQNQQDEKNKKQKAWNYILGAGLALIAITDLADFLLGLKSKKINKAEKETLENLKKDLKNNVEESLKKYDDKMKDFWENFKQEASEEFINKKTNNVTAKTTPKESPISSNKSTPTIQKADTSAKQPIENTENAIQNKSTPTIQKADAFAKQPVENTDTVKFKEVNPKAIEDIMEGIILEDLRANIEKDFIGYEKEKQFIQNKLITPIIKQDKNKIPNILMFFGPKGTGKSRLANEIANSKYFDNTKFYDNLNHAENLSELNEILSNANKNFEKTGKKTCIRFDEIDSILDDNKSLDEYKKVFKKLSDNHAVLVATTNYPNIINKISNVPKTEILYVAPINQNDLTTLLKQLTKGIVTEPVDFELLSQQLVKQAGNNAYSTAKIIGSFERAITEIGCKRSITQQDLLDISKDVVPNIRQENLEIYKPYLKYSA